MPAAWARMIYVCGFLQDKGVLYRIRHRNLHGFLASLLRQEVYALRACRAYARRARCETALRTYLCSRTAVELGPRFFLREFKFLFASKTRACHFSQHF